jgi:hypothetical protein
MKILEFLKARLLHFIVYAVIGIALWGVYQKVFVKPDTVSNDRHETNNMQPFSGAQIKTWGCATIRK